MLSVLVTQPRPQENIGDYHVVAEIAAGGMATVHLGYRKGDATCTPVAIKRLHPQFTHDPEFLTMFADEVRVVSHIQHPNVVSTLDIVQDRRALSLVLPYVHGEAFSKLLGAAYKNGHPASPALVRTVMVDVLRGLHAAHEARDVNGMPLEIVHRDVSPQNVIVGTDGIARILDFGIAKAIGRATVTRENEVRGKVAYMAPEQLQRGQVDRRTDVYAAAIIIWEALTCKRLFHSETDAKTLARVLTLDVTPPSHHRSGVSPELDRAVLCGLSRDPEHRFPTALEFANAIAASGPGISRQELGMWVQSIAAEKLAERTALVSGMRAIALGQFRSPSYSPSSLPPSQADVSGVRSASMLSRTKTLTHHRASRGPGGKALIAAATAALSIGLGAWLSRQFPQHVGRLLGLPSDPPVAPAATVYSLAPQIPSTASPTEPQVRPASTTAVSR